MTTKTENRNPNAQFLDTECPHCGQGFYRETDDANIWWVKCDDCEHLQFCYVPMKHQLRYHMDPAKFKLFAGGYGSAKTSTNGAEFVMLAMSTPYGTGLVGAQTYPQLEQTAKKQVMEMLPEELIQYESKKDNMVILTNGYEILFRSFDDQQKLRSLNLCHVLIEEANGVPYEVFIQLQTRLRHHATTNHRILLSSNPDANWIKTQFLLKSARIVGSTVKYRQVPEEINYNYATHIAKTEYNTHLPPNYIADVSVGKPDHWIRRYLEGSFEQTEGRVYPNFEKCIVTDQEITVEQIKFNIKTLGWKVITGTDFGLRDDTTLLQGAIDSDNGIIYFYDEYQQNQLSVASHAMHFKERLKHIPLGLLMKMVGDPAGQKRSTTDMKSIFDHYAEHGIHFMAGNNRIEAGILKVFGYIESGRMKVHESLRTTIDQHINYMYKEAKEGEKQKEVPIDTNNHNVDTLRYIIGELPDDPNNLANESFGITAEQNIMEQLKIQQLNEKLPFQLQEEDDNLANYSDAWYNSY